MKKKKKKQTQKAKTNSPITWSPEKEEETNDNEGLDLEALWKETTFACFWFGCCDPAAAATEILGRGTEMEAIEESAYIFLPKKETKTETTKTKKMSLLWDFGLYSCEGVGVRDM